MMEKHIISASRRTDIPAFYSEWLMNRIRAGSCRIINPFYPEQKTHPVDLSPEAVECIVFWTRNPAPLMQHLHELDARSYVYYFLYTILGYPAIFDPASPNRDEAVQAFQRLSRRIGPERVRWRYDPIVLTDQTPVDWHQKQIAAIAAALQGYTTQMIFSFVVDYRHAQARYQSLRNAGIEFVSHDDAQVQQQILVEWIGQTMPDFGMEARICSDRHYENVVGIHKAHCIDRALINQLTSQGRRDRKDPAQRVDCGCCVSRDIGAHDTCLARCFYCYATKDFDRARKNFQRHDACAEYLVCP